MNSDNMKITHKKALEKIVKKLENLKAKPATIKAYNNEAIKIINSNYKIVERLEQINKNITPETKTLTDVRKKISGNKQEAKQETLAKKHSPTLNGIKAFNQNKNAFIKVLATLDKIPKKIFKSKIYQ
jgi:wyosine [tRNA(Phe)-imidazoG37] synthetase (radical SAM superfamily)